MKFFNTLLVILLFGTASFGQQNVKISLATGEAVVSGQYMQPSAVKRGEKLQVLLSGYRAGQSFEIELKSGAMTVKLDRNSAGVANAPHLLFVVDANGNVTAANKTIGIPFNLNVTVAGQKKISDLQFGGVSGGGMTSNGNAFFAKASEDPHLFYDAVRLAERVQVAVQNDNLVAKGDEMFTILSAYSNRRIESVAAARIVFPRETNPYIHSLIEPLSDGMSMAADKVASDEEIGFAQSASVLGSLIPPTQTIDAIATFMAKRFKQELNVAFLNEFRKMMQRYEQMQTVFPSTWTLLKHAEPYNYTTFLTSLQEAFRDDLSKMDHNALQTLRLAEKQLLDKDPNGYMAYATMLNLIEGAQAGLPIADMIETTGTQHATNVNTVSSEVIELIAILSRNLRHRERPERGWMPSSDLSMISRPFAAQSFVGLLLMKEEKALQNVMINRQSVHASLLSEDPAQASEFIANFMRDIITLNRRIEELNKVEVSGNRVNQKEFTAQEYAEYLREIVYMMENAIDLAVQLGANPTEVYELREYLDMVKLGLAIHESVNQKNYGLALSQSIALYEMISKKLNINSPVKFNEEVLKEMSRFGHFMVVFAKAETKEEMLEALEAAALPVGSYRIKRESLCNVSINMYGGAFAGQEIFINADSLGDRQAGFTTGAFAPVGVSFTFGIPSEKYSSRRHSYLSKDKQRRTMSGWSGSIFISVIDVGAVFAVRLQDSVSTLPELKWENVIAPGAYGILNIKGMPVSVGAGVQYGPQLRQVKITDGNGAEAIIEPNAIRLNAFIAVDIPFFNIYTKRFRN